MHLTIFGSVTEVKIKMNNSATIVICILLGILCIYSVISYAKKLKNGCCGAECGEIPVKPKDTDISHYPYKTTVYINGMTCNGCKIRIENAFNRLDNTYAKVNLKKKYADIHSTEPVAESKIREIIEQLGYECIKIL